jgi:hypothetical protein
MRFRLGLFIGLAIGYTLGAKAGTKRYEQIRSAWRAVAGSDKAQQLTTEVRHVATSAGSALEQKAAEGIDKVTDLVTSEPKGRNGALPPG